MTPAQAAPPTRKSRIGDSALAARLRREVEGEVLFDAFSRGRYSTDASIYQIEPIGVVVPRSRADIVRTIQIAAAEGVPVLPRGGGTSQCGQTVGEAIVIDVSKHLTGIKDFDSAARRITVEPGLVLDHLNSHLNPTACCSRSTSRPAAGRPSAAWRATTPAARARSAYGTMRDNVRAIDAVLADGRKCQFGEVPATGKGADLSQRAAAQLVSA